MCKCDSAWILGLLCIGGFMKCTNLGRTKWRRWGSKSKICVALRQEVILTLNSNCKLNNYGPAQSPRIDCTHPVACQQLQWWNPLTRKSWRHQEKNLWSSIQLVQWHQRAQHIRRLMTFDLCPALPPHTNSTQGMSQVFWPSSCGVCMFPLWLRR